MVNSVPLQNQISSFIAAMSTSPCQAVILISVGGVFSLSSASYSIPAGAQLDIVSTASSAVTLQMSLAMTLFQVQAGGILGLKGLVLDGMDYGLAVDTWAVKNYGTTVIKSCIFQKFMGTSSVGGSIFSEGEVLYVKDSAFRWNTAANDATVVVADGIGRFFKTRFYQNVGGSTGGAALVVSKANSYATDVLLSQCNFTSNTGAFGVAGTSRSPRYHNIHEMNLHCSLIEAHQARK